MCATPLPEPKRLLVSAFTLMCAGGHRCVGMSAIELVSARSTDRASVFVLHAGRAAAAARAHSRVGRR